MTTLLAPRLHRYSFRDYLELEEASNVKHEFLDGEIYAMAGGTPAHAALAMAVGAALLAQLRGRGCRVYSSDLRVRVLATGLATYPDVTVVCGDLEHDPDSRTTVVNPAVVVEVTSESSEEYDRGDKLAAYQAIPSLRECVLVSHRDVSVEVFERTEGAWRRRISGAGERARLPSVAPDLDVDEVYRDAGVA